MASLAATNLDMVGLPKSRYAPKTAAFSPYVNNGGTTIAVAGPNFCVIGADTRLSSGYSIHTRNFTKAIQLTPKCVLATSGMQADTLQLQKVLKYRIEMYEHQNGKTPSTPAIAQLLSNTLYYRRFFPYYTFNVLGGVDDNGVGVVYSYDAIGSFELVPYSSSGTGQTLIQPFLDNQIGWKNNTKPVGSAQDVKTLLEDAFSAAGERDIYTGDSADIWVVTPEGIERHLHQLKKD